MISYTVTGSATSLFVYTTFNQDTIKGGIIALACLGGGHTFPYFFHRLFCRGFRVRLFSNLCNIC